MVCDNATEEANFEVGLYDDDSSNDRPGLLISSDTTNAKGTTAGWKSVAVDWEILPNTVYWIALQVDSTTTGTLIDYDFFGGTGGHSFLLSQTSLPADWDAGGNRDTDSRVAIYAVWEASADSCTCAGASTNWEVDLEDFCVITDACDLTTGNLTFINIGNFTCDAQIDLFNLGDVGSGSVLYVNDECVINVN